jgi:hypothetical protein
MTQEDKEFLLKDLCARLLYGVKISVNDRIETLEGIHVLDAVAEYGSCLSSDIEKVKPYLFPLSSMTEEQTEEVHNLIYQGISESIEETKEWLKTRKENELRPITLTYILSYTLVIDWFCKNHFDYRGLIPMGLAMDATNLNIY